ncbi:MAG: hypothetical protein QM820_16395 [Minicystis sp.]
MTPLLLAITAATAVSVADGAPIPAGTGPTPDARPQQQQAPKAVAAISAEIMVLHGTNDGSGIDPKIGKMPELGKPPFSSYNSYKLLDCTTASVDKGKAAAHTLPTGRDLQVVFKDVVEPAKKGEAPRYVISASIQKPGGKAFLPLVEVNAKAGEWFFVAGQDYKGGTLVIGIRVNP